MSRESLFTPLKIGPVTASNRIFMALLTRNRADASGVPGELAQTYYRQRAGAGLIITEATQISPMGRGYRDTPGIHSPQQIARWRDITDGVHEAGGHIALQLWHVGRISHASLLPGGAQPVSASAIRARTWTVTYDGVADTSTPRALSREEIDAIVADYARAARNAIEAGFDMVELHAANGYLVDQFLRDGVNRRTDEYGGPVENRIRFLEEVTRAIAGEIGAERLGVRLSPVGQFNDMSDSDPKALFSAAARALARIGVAYLHVVEEFSTETALPDAPAILAAVRAAWPGLYIANGNYAPDRAAAAVESGHADAVAFGRDFIANPDLPARIRSGAPLNEGNPATYYGGGAEGYIDYPALHPAAAEHA